MADEFTFIGSVTDNAPRANQKGRADRRMVKESISNVLLNSGEEIVLVDAKERGDLYEVRVVSDNPYLEVYIELDDYRNENVSAAELLAQPQTGRLLSNFQAIDGGSPAAGYTLLYNPDIPEDYQGRIRVILRNRIRPSKDVFGNPGAGRGAYRSRGDLASPINLGYGGGAVIPHNHTASDPDRLTHVAYNMAVGDDFNNVEGLKNRAFLSAAGVGLKRGALHPYVGSAGIPVLDQSEFITRNPNIPMTNTLHVFFDDVVEHGAADLVWPRNTEQDIYIVDFAGPTALAAGAKLVAGNRLFFKDRNNVYFPGVIDAVATAQTLPTRFAANGASQYTQAIKITVKPGLASPPPPIVYSLYDPTNTERPTEGEPNGGSMGTLTTPADTNPPVLVYGAEIRRLKRVSYDG